MTPLHHLLRPLRGGSAGVLLVFPILLWIGTSAGLFGLPLQLLVLSWLFKYAYILFDHVVRGFDAPPALDIKMVNPADEQRPLAQLLIILGVGALIYWLSGVAPGLAVVIGIAATLSLPASIAILGLEGNPLKAVYPPALYRMIAGLGWTYPGVLAMITVVGLAAFASQRLHLWLPLNLLIGMFGILSMFSLLGGALYERRDELGLETWHSPERTEERERLADLKDSEQVITEAYGQARVGAHTKAWDLLQDWLTSRGNDPADYRWLCPKVDAWPDPRYGNRLVQEFVERLLSTGRTGEAIDSVRDRLLVDPGFRPKSAASTLRIAQLAARGGGAIAVARTLIGDFPQRFPGDKLCASAAVLARHLGE